MLSFLIFLSIFVAGARAGKRGLCWAWYDASLNPGLFNTASDEVVAIYDYETYQPPSTNGDGGLDFIGMQRCLDCDSSPIADLLSRSQQQDWETVFTLNEPDLNGITPSQAASWYIEYINPLPIRKALPAVSSSLSTGQGLSWLSQMINACAGKCNFDYINLHWYGGSFSDFNSYIESARAQFPNYPMVISEFALQLNPPGSQQDQVTFFQQAFSFLDSASYVELYFPFLATTPSLLTANDNSAATGLGTGLCLYNDDGSLSAVGQLMIASSTPTQSCPASS